MTVEELKKRIEEEARREEFSIDVVPYRKSSRDPHAPILFAGNLDSRIAFFARDLGWNEVLLGEPLIGDAGQRVRTALFRAILRRDPPAGDVYRREALDGVLLTNTVPYKPVGNKAYSTGVRERFRPFIAQLIVCLWRGDSIVTMGTEAFQWFRPYADKPAFDAFWKREDRFEAQIEVLVEADCDGKAERKSVTLAPLPHPSPLNQAWLARFPELLEHRLRQLGLAPKK